MIRANCTAKCRFAFTFLFAMAAFTGLACLGNEARADDDAIDAAERDCEELTNLALQLPAPRNEAAKRIYSAAFEHCLNAKKARQRVVDVTQELMTGETVSEFEIEIYHEALDNLRKHWLAFGVHAGQGQQAKYMIEEGYSLEGCDEPEEDDADYYMGDDATFRPADWKRM